MRLTNPNVNFNSSKQRIQFVFCSLKRQRNENSMENMFEQINKTQQNTIQKYDDGAFLMR